MLAHLFKNLNNMKPLDTATLNSDYENGYAIHFILNWEN